MAIRSTARSPKKEAAADTAGHVKRTARSPKKDAGTDTAGHAAVRTARGASSKKM